MPEKKKKEVLHSTEGIKVSGEDENARPDDNEVVLTKGQVRKKVVADYLTGNYNYNQLGEKYDLTIEQIEDVLMTPEELEQKRGFKAPEVIPGRDV